MLDNWTMFLIDLKFNFQVNSFQCVLAVDAQGDMYAVLIYGYLHYGSAVTSDYQVYAKVR